MGAEKRWGSLETFLDMVGKARDKASYIDKKLSQELDRIGKQYGMIDSSQSEPVRKRSRSRSRERRRSRSRSRSKDRRRDRSRSRERRRKSRSRSRERRRRSRSRSPSTERRTMKFARPGEKIVGSSFSRRNEETH